MANPPDKNVRTRWILIICVTVLGFLVTASPFIAAAVHVDGFEGPLSVASSTLTNVGTTLLLVSAVYFLERGFTERVSEAAAKNATQAVAGETEAIRQRTEELGIKLEDLTARVSERTKARAEREDAALNALSTVASFDNVAEVLEQANGLQALWFGDLTVPAGRGVDAPRVRFSWRPHHVDGTAANGEEVFESPDKGIPRMILKYDTSAEENSAISVELDWKPQQPADEIIAELQRQMTGAGDHDAAERVTDEVFANLARAARVAIESRRGAVGGAWVRGPMDEWLADGWAVSEAGLDASCGAGLRADEFPDALEDFHPSAPANVEQDWWNFAVARAGRRHSHPVDRTHQSTDPYTPDTTPRGGHDWLPEADRQ